MITSIAIKCINHSLVAILILSLSTSPVFAQGPLTPPGPPAPTMKTLQQVEPRIPITNATAVSINSQGSYYLTTNITVSSGDGVLIGAPNVTLDLNGFMISSIANPANGRGIVVTQHDTTILNGHISGGVTNAGPGVYNGPGFTSGITWFAFNAPFNVRVSGVTVSGCQLGINLTTNSSTVVESCAMQGIGFYGIYAGTVANSVVLDCGDTAIFGDTVSNYRGTVTGPGAGIKAGIANNCYGSSSSTGTGLVAVIATSCYGISSGGPGLVAEVASNCRGIGTSGTGLSATNAVTCYGSSNTGGGLRADTAINCKGVSSSNNGLAASTASNCRGQSDGAAALIADVANNCNGDSISSYGLFVYDVAIGCLGQSTSGPGLHADTANSCYGVGSPRLDVSHPYNMVYP